MSKQETTKQFTLNVEYEIGEEVYISPYWRSVHADHSGKYLTVKIIGYEYLNSQINRYKDDEPVLRYWTTYSDEYSFYGSQLFRTIEAAKDYDKKNDEREKTLQIERESQKYLEAVKVVKEYESKFKGSK